MSGPDKDLPSIPASVDPNLRGPLERIREAVQRLMGVRGDDRRAAVLWEDLQEGGLADTRLNWVPGGVGGSWSGVGVPDADLTMPVTPTGLAAAAALTHVLIEWDAPIYTQGHGHKQTNIYATKQPSADATLYTFADAVLVDTVPGATTVRSLPSDLGIKWRIWIKWESVDGVESSPAGGANGYVVTTGRIGGADITDLAIAAAKLADGAVDLTSNKVKASTEFGALAVGYTVTQYLVATSGVMGNLVVDNAQISSLSAAKLTSGSLAVGANAQSTGYVAGTSGWIIRGDGYAEFSNIVIRGATYTGTIYASAGTIGGITIASAYMRAGQIGFDNGNGFYLGSDGRFSVGNSSGAKLTWDGSVLNVNGSGAFSGTITASGGTIGGIVIGSDYIMSSNFVTGVSGWRTKSDGTAEFNGVVTSRNMVIASGLLQIFQSQTAVGSFPTNPTPIDPEANYTEYLLGDFYIDTGYAIESWNATSEALVSATGLYKDAGAGLGGMGIWWTISNPSNPGMLFFEAKVVSDWEWSATPTIRIKVSIIGKFHSHITHFMFNNFNALGGVSWKLYRVT